MSPDLLNDSVAVYSATNSKTATGGATRSWTAVNGKDAVPCHSQQISSENVEIFGTTRLAERAMFFFDEDPGIDTHQSIVLASSGNRYYVVSVENIGNLDISWEIVGALIEGTDG